MPDLNKIARTFRLFNEKADKLFRLRFFEQLSHPDAGVTMHFERNKEGGGTINQERRGPDEEAIDAFLLTFRFFFQDNENTSFRNMEKYYLAAPIDDSLKQEFVTLRQQVNEYLDRKININFNNEDLTHRQLVDVFLYGGLAHGNENKRRLYKTWMSSMMASFLEHEFLMAVAKISVAIREMKAMNERALEHLPGPS